jgi:hypothetical protein
MCTPEPFVESPASREAFDKKEVWMGFVWAGIQLQLNIFKRS